MPPIPALVAAVLALQAPCLAPACDVDLDAGAPEPSAPALVDEPSTAPEAHLPVPVPVDPGTPEPGELLATHLPDPREGALEAPTRSAPAPAHEPSADASTARPSSALTSPVAAREPAPESAPRAHGEATQAPHAPHQATASAAGAPVDGPPADRTLAGLALGALLVVLYHRLSKERLLEHATRQRILDLLEDEPGLATTELAERLDVSYRTARHHAATLARFGLVVRLDTAGPERWSRPDDASDVPERLPAELRRLLDAVSRAEGVHLSALARRLGLAKATAKHRLDRLLERGWVEDERVGPLRRFRVTEAGRQRLDTEV